LHQIGSPVRVAGQPAGNAIEHVQLLQRQLLELVPRQLHLMNYREECQPASTIATVVRFCTFCVTELGLLPLLSPACHGAWLNSVAVWQMFSGSRRGGQKMNFITDCINFT